MTHPTDNQTAPALILSQNSFIGLGRLTAEPEQAGEGVKFSLAINRDGGKKVDFIKCVVFPSDERPYSAACLLRKGELVRVTGQLQTWQTATGIQRWGVLLDGITKPFNDREHGR